jgi:hypothetical protein
MTMLDLTEGDHDLSEPAVAWLPHAIDSHPPQVELIASIQSSPRRTSVPNRGETATSVAIRMDARVAIDLHARLTRLARRMGWKLQE